MENQNQQYIHLLSLDQPIDIKDLEKIYLAIQRLHPFGISKNRLKIRLKAKDILVREKNLLVRKDLYLKSRNSLEQRKLKKIELESNLFLVFKEAGWPTLSLDFLDSASLESLLRESSHDHLPEAGLLHRLDNDASGWVLCTNKEEKLQRLIHLRKSGEVSSIYRLTARPSSFISDLLEKKQTFYQDDYCEIVLSEEENFHKFTVNLAIAKKSARKMQVLKLDDASPKQSCFYLEKKGLRNEKWELYAEIVKGARHQLRLSAQFLGFPLLGESLYEDSSGINLELGLFCLGLKAGDKYFLAEKLPFST